MTPIKANINKILKSSFVDGPGNRMVIFFQGCQFNCSYCHNHQTIGICNSCGICVDTCPSSSLNITDEKIIHNALSCSNCDKCISICPVNSNPLYRQYSVDELINEILEIKDFISGITLSGGEVMLQYIFVCELFAELKQNKYLKHLSLFIDSNGDCELNALKAVSSYTDGFMIDIKAASESVHKQITGRTNLRVLNSIKYLDYIHKLYEIRTVIVSEINDSDTEIEALSKIYSSINKIVRRVIIKLRMHGVRKEYKHIKPASDTRMIEIANRLGPNTIII